MFYLQLNTVITNIYIKQLQIENYSYASIAYGGMFEYVYNAIGLFMLLLWNILSLYSFKDGILLLSILKMINLCESNIA